MRLTKRQTALHRFASVVHKFLRRIGADTLSTLRRTGRVPLLTRWIEPLAAVVKPTLLRVTESAAKIYFRELLASRKRRRPRPPVSTSGVSRPATPTDVQPPPLFPVAGAPPAPPVEPPIPPAAAGAGGGEPPTIQLAFGYVHPDVVRSVDEAALTFDESTLQTSQLGAQEAIEAARVAIREGYTRGEAVDTVTKRIQKIFNDPERALLIARTELSRATHRGRMIAAKAAGQRWKEWSSNPPRSVPPITCPLCLQLDGVVKPIDEPFHVDPRGGPYAVTQCPPRHPGCYCGVFYLDYDPRPFRREQ
jgi:hypothetical protein